MTDLTKDLDVLTQIRETYLDLCVDELREIAVSERKRVNLDTLYEFSGMKKRFVREILTNNTELHAKIKLKLKKINKEIMQLNKMKYQFVKDYYMRADLPKKRQNDTKFLRFVDAWNNGERNKRQLSEIAGVHVDTIYHWLKELI